MVAFHKILLPVDLSEDPSAVVPYVLTMAEKFSSEIHILFAVSALGKYASFYGDEAMMDSMEAKALRKARERMDAFIKRSFGNSSSIESVVVLGDAANEIIKYVESAKIDLVVMRTHGREGIRCLMFGSVAEEVIKSVEVPALSIHRA